MEATIVAETVAEVAVLIRVDTQRVLSIHTECSMTAMEFLLSVMTILPITTKTSVSSEICRAEQHIM